jgi:hypothetical protein
MLLGLRAVVPTYRADCWRRVSHVVSELGRHLVPETPLCDRCRLAIGMLHGLITATRSSLMYERMSPSFDNMTPHSHLLCLLMQATITLADSSDVEVVQARHGSLTCRICTLRTLSHMETYRAACESTFCLLSGYALLLLMLLNVGSGPYNSRHSIRILCCFAASSHCTKGFRI